MINSPLDDIRRQHVYIRPMRTVKTDSETEIAEALRAMIGYRKNQGAVARELGISRSYLNEILAGKKKVGPVILSALGYDPTPRYARKNGSKS